MADNPTETMQKIIPVIGVPPQPPKAPKPIINQTAAIQQPVLPPEELAKLEKFIAENLKDPETLTPSQLSKRRKRLRKRWMAMRTANLKLNIPPKAPKKKKATKVAPVKTVAKKAKVVVPPKKKADKKPAVPPLIPPKNFSTGVMRLTRDGDYEPMNRPLKRLMDEPIQAYNQNNQTYPENNHMGMGYPQNEHFINQPVYPESEPMPFQQNNQMGYAPNEPSYYPPVEQQHQEYQQEYQQNYQQSYEPIRAEYPKPGEYYEQPRDWMDKTWRGPEEFKPYPTGSFSAFLTSTTPVSNYLTSSLPPPQSLAMPMPTTSNFYAPPAPVPPQPVFETSYAPMMPDLISQAAASRPMMPPASFQQPETYPTPPRRQRTPTPVRDSTPEAEKVARQQRLLEIEQELKIIEQQKMELAMEDELRRRETEIQERERWLAARERQLYEMEMNSQRRWNGEQRPESYYQERPYSPPHASHSQQRRQRSRNHPTREEPPAPAAVSKKNKKEAAADIATRDRLRDERDADAARRHGQRGSQKKRFGPAATASTSSAPKPSQSGAEGNRSGRIQAAANIQAKRKAKHADLRTEKISDDEY